MTSKEKFYVAKYLKEYANDFDEWIEEEYEQNDEDPKDAITAYEISRDLEEEANKMESNEPVKLTFGQLQEMLDDIVLKNIAFDDSGVHASEVKELLKRYGD